MKKSMFNSTKLLAGIVALGMVTVASCDKNDDPDLPPINGYNSSDEVAATANVAKWSFDGSLTESKGNLTGTSTNTAFVTGAKGQAYEGSSTQARYAIYNVNPNVQSATSLSVSFWIKAPQNVPNPDPTPVQGKGIQGIFSLTDPTDFWGGINMFIENNERNGIPNTDTLRLKLFWRNKRAGVVWQGQDPNFYVPASVDKWVHVTFTYDAASSKVVVYKNGVKGGVGSLTGPYGPFDGENTLYADNPGAGSGNPNGAPLHGALQFPTAGKMIVGACQFSTDPSLGSAGAQPWATTFRGLLDEFRIYNKALSSSEVESIYQLEAAGR
jgi:Concanavalin A-like lectin/glucanases superfamily